MNLPAAGRFNRRTNDSVAQSVNETLAYFIFTFLSTLSLQQFGICESASLCYALALKQRKRNIRSGDLPWPNPTVAIEALGKHHPRDIEVQPKNKLKISN